MFNMIEEIFNIVSSTNINLSSYFPYVSPPKDTGSSQNVLILAKGEPLPLPATPELIVTYVRFFVICFMSNIFTPAKNQAYFTLSAHRYSLDKHKRSISYVKKNIKP